MQTRRAYAIGMAVSGMIFWVGGCGSQPQGQAVAPVPSPVNAPIPAVDPKASDEPQVARVEGEPDAGDVESEAPKPASPDRLAKQAEEHAKAIEALLAAREQEQDQVSGVRVIRDDPKPAPKQAPTQDLRPVEVKFEDPQPVKVAGEAPVSETPQVATVQTTTQVPVSVVEPEVVSASMSRANTPMRVTTDQPSEVVVHRSTSPQPGAIHASSGADTLEQQLARRAREYPRDLPSQLDYQLLLFTKDEQVPRNADLAGLASEDRELLTALVDGLTNFRNAIRADNNMLMNRKIRPLVEMSDRLRSRADLSIPNALLCREVKGFGTYAPIESTRFEAGKAHKVIVYSEVENFASVLNDKSLWETRLEQELVLYTESGLPVWEEKTPTTDFCRNRRRDFFIARIVTIPANLTMGRYVLKVSVTDQQASRIAETSIPIAVVAK
jgi:hypothetical protein